MALGTAPAGWYADNRDAGLLRWWDGVQWTAYTQTLPGQDPGPAAAQASAAPAAAAQAAPGRHERRPASKRDLHGEVDRLQQILDGPGVTEREQLAREVTGLREEAARLRQEHAGLSAVVVPLRAEMAVLSAQRAQLGTVQAGLQQLQQRRDALAAETAGPGTG